ncbi:MAG TPA: hypothetical protein HA277_04140 [Methanosphaera sp.]|jgi:hypothetical protein|nr:hypothetical protein [Methanosphaera sp.]
MENRLNAKDMLERTIEHIEENYSNEINQCYKEISDAADNCKFSTKIDLIAPVCAGTIKKYFMYKGYNAKLTGGTLELAWNVNFDGTDVSNILRDRAFIRAFI